MSIQSTKDISRKHAVERIVMISELILSKKYRSLEEETNEPDYNLQKFVDGYTQGSLKEEDLEEWTDTMIEEKMDEPFFRWSLFDNYHVTKA